MAPSDDLLLDLSWIQLSRYVRESGDVVSLSTHRDGAIMSHRIRNAFAWSLVLAAALVWSVNAQILPTQFGEAVDRDVTAVRAATEAFRLLDNAVAAGYERHVSQCVENRPAGGMGFHHAKAALRDANLEVDKPEILTYARTPDGEYKLTGVEYVVPISEWSRSEPPTIMGRSLKRAESLGIWYLHVWIWEPNPSGLFADWNPRVKC
jgi:hypothetical protein